MGRKKTLKQKVAEEISGASFSTIFTSKEEWDEEAERILAIVERELKKELRDLWKIQKIM